MENLLIDVAVSQGIWALLAIFLLIYFIKSNEKRDENYQNLIQDIMKQFSVLDNLKEGLEEIKSMLNKRQSSQYDKYLTVQGHKKTVEGQILVFLLRKGVR